MTSGNRSRQVLRDNLRHAQMLVQAPSKALKPFVKRFLVVESTAAHDDTHLPDTGLVAAFRYRGDCLLNGGNQAPQAAIAGLMDTVRTHAHSRDHAVVIVAFTAVGAAALLRRPVEEFANTTVDLHDVLSSTASLRCLHEQMAVAANHSQRIRLIEDLLIMRAGDAEPDPLVAAAAGLIESTHAMIRIDELTRRIGLSQSALERRFRRLVGTSPRRFTSLVRLQNVVQLAETGTDLTTIAHVAGYCDLPHFIKDFKRFTGVAPGSFFGPPAS